MGVSIDEILDKVASIFWLKLVWSQYIWGNHLWRLGQYHHHRREQHHYRDRVGGCGSSDEDLVAIHLNSPAPLTSHCQPTALIPIFLDNTIITIQFFYFLAASYDNPIVIVTLRPLFLSFLRWVNPPLHVAVPCFSAIWVLRHVTPSTQGHWHHLELMTIKRSPWNTFLNLNNILRWCQIYIWKTISNLLKITSYRCLWCFYDFEQKSWYIIGW